MKCYSSGNEVIFVDDDCPAQKTVNSFLPLLIMVALIILILGVTGIAVTQPEPLPRRTIPGEVSAELDKRIGKQSYVVEPAWIAKAADGKIYVAREK
jgi:hypothetical protein